MEGPDHPCGWLETASAAPVECGAGGGEGGAYRCGALGTHRPAAGRSPRLPPPFPEDAGALGAAGAAKPRRLVFHGGVLPLPALGAGADIGADGEGMAGGIDPPGEEGHGGAVRDPVFKAYSKPLVRAAGRACNGVQGALLGVGVVSVRAGDQGAPKRCGVSDESFDSGGVHADGVREILGFEGAAPESGRRWSDWFTPRLDRGRPGVSDGHPGRVRALEPRFPSAPWPRCPVYLARNVRDRCPSRWPASRRPRLHQLQPGSRPHDVRGDGRGVWPEGDHGGGSAGGGTGRGHGGVNAALEVSAPVAYPPQGGALD